MTGLEEKGKETYFKRFQDEQAPHLKGKKKRLHISIRKATFFYACFPIGPVVATYVRGCEELALVETGKASKPCPCCPAELSFSSKSSRSLFIPDTH